MRQFAKQQVLVGKIAGPSSTLSRITDIDFWVSMVSFGALPLFTLLTSQFPSVNRFFYSWIRPAIESLNH